MLIKHSSFKKSFSDNCPAPTLHNNHISPNLVSKMERSRKVDHFQKHIYIFLHNKT